MEIIFFTMNDNMKEKAQSMIIERFLGWKFLTKYKNSF